MDGRVGWEIMNLLIRKNERIVKDLIKKRQTQLKAMPLLHRFLKGDP